MSVMFIVEKIKTDVGKEKKREFENVYRYHIHLENVEFLCLCIEETQEIVQIDLSFTVGRTFGNHRIDQIFF